MAQTAFGGMTFLGYGPHDTIAYDTMTIDASGELAAFVFRVPKSGNIDRISFTTHAVTTSETLSVGIYNLDGSGNPDTASAYGSMVAGTKTSPAAHAMYEVTLGTAATATVGNYVAVVIGFSSTVGNLVIRRGTTGTFKAGAYSASYASSTWTKSSRQPMLSVRYDDGTYWNVGNCPALLYEQVDFNSNSTPDERALYVTMPFDVTAVGIYAYMDADNAMDAVLYDTDGTTALQTVAVTPVARESATEGWTIFPFTGTVLSSGGTYRAAIKPTSTSTITYFGQTALSAAHLATMAWGANACLSTRANAGAWTEATTKMPMIGLMVTAVDIGAGGATFPNVMGGGPVQ